MGINKKKTIVIYSISYLIFTMLVIGLYLVFSNSYTKEYRRNYSDQYQDVIIDNLDKKFTNQISYFDELLLNNTINDLNDNLEKLNEFNNNSYLKFGSLVDNKIIYNNLTIDIYKADILLNKNIGISNNKLFIVSSSNYVLIELNSFINDNIMFTKASNLFIMNKTGVILYHSNNDKAELLSSYLSIDTTPYFTNYFGLNKDVIIDSKSSSGKIFTNFKTLNNFTDIYIGQTFLYKELTTLTNQNILFLAIIIIVYTIATYLLFVWLFNYFNVLNSDIEFRKYSHYYVKPYVIGFNNKGNIVKFNQRFKENIINYRQIKSIDTINNINELNIELTLETLDRGKPVTLVFVNKVIRFIPLTYKKLYYLIGEEVSHFDNDQTSIELLAYYDEVTLLPNKHLLKQSYQKHIDKELEDISGGMIGFSINDFNTNLRLFNELISTKILKDVSDRLKDILVNDNGKLFKITDGNFVFMYEDLVLEQVKEITEKVIKSFDKPFKIYNNTILIKLNAGIYEFNSKVSFDDVCRSLNLTVNKALESNSKDYFIYDNNFRQLFDYQLEIEKNLIKAIEKDEFIVYLQPQYSNILRRITGFEALIRWNNSTYLNKSPQEYISVAEKNGLINEIGNIIIDKSFEIAKKLKPYNIAISLNVSPIQLLQQGFVDEILKKHAYYNLEPNSVNIEITENYLVEQFTLINEKLKILKKNGIGIHLDDFGTGYSSLPYLKELTFDAIKIDREYIMHIETDKYHKAIANMLITLAKNLEVDIIAEGVETDAQNNYLVKNGCSIIQGFYISKPVNFDEAIVLLQKYNGIIKGGN